MGRFISATFSSDRNSPAGASPTDPERIELFKTMSATSGTYKVQEGKVAITYDGSWVQGWTGKTQVREVTVSGTTMTFRSPQQPSGSTGVMIVFTAALEKVEQHLCIRAGAPRRQRFGWCRMVTWLPGPVERRRPTILGARSLAHRQT